MILKHFDSKNGTCFFHADEFITKTCYVREYYKGTLKNMQTKNLGNESLTLNEYHFFDKGRNSRAYNAMTHTILMLANTPENVLPQFVIKEKYEDLDKVLVVVAKEPSIEDTKIFVFSSTVYLMTDEGKTIEKLI